MFKRKINIKFLLASLKTLANSKDCPLKRIKFLFRLSFALIRRFSPAYIHGRLSEQFSESQVAFGTSLKITGCHQKSQNKLPEEGYWNWKDSHKLVRHT
jgi:hypothetical protein